MKQMVYWALQLCASSGAQFGIWCRAFMYIQQKSIVRKALIQKSETNKHNGTQAAICHSVAGATALLSAAQSWLDALHHAREELHNARQTLRCYGFQQAPEGMWVNVFCHSLCIPVQKRFGKNHVPAGIIAS